MTNTQFQVVDLFAGPGGLGEGFSSFKDKFKILVSAEMEKSAHKTLMLRAYYRQLKSNAPELLGDYYDYCNGISPDPVSERTEGYWKKALYEARQITLGSPEGNKELDDIIDAELDPERPWVLIGGPPCQAYSLVGRARNKGKVGYSAHDDHRHFLYKEYLRIISRYRPTVFVMENVKGILSSTVSGKRIFHDILEDLTSPDAASGKNENERYVICSLTTGEVFRHDDSASDFDVSKFIIRAENHGIPQARHRVILLGIKESLYSKVKMLRDKDRVSVRDVLSDLPPIRSKLSRQADSWESWQDAFVENLDSLLHELAADKSKLVDLAPEFTSLKTKMRSALSAGMLRIEKDPLSSGQGRLDDWYNDPRLEVWLNHEARGHMVPDLKRYMFASTFAQVYKTSPKGAVDFALPGLRPNHKNWNSGKFADRFRVQVFDRPSTTITSHIAKDGHYFIHPDPSQCRSFTVREAARLQTFPDNYFFQGNRTQQFHQVGNAVPPLLAHQIAEIVSSILEGWQCGVTQAQ